MDPIFIMLFGSHLVIIQTAMTIHCSVQLRLHVPAVAQPQVSCERLRSVRRMFLTRSMASRLT